MSNKKNDPKQADLNHKSNQANANDGTSGTNDAYQAMLDNRSKQIKENKSK